MPTDNTESADASHTGSALPSRDDTVTKGAILGAWVTLVMVVLVALTALEFSMTHGGINDGTWEGLWCVVCGFPFLLIIPGTICAVISSDVLHWMACTRMLTTWPGLAIGVLWGVAWAVTIDIVGNYNVSSGILQGNPAWLVVLLTIAMLTWCWHGWRVTRYIRRNSGRVS